MKLLYCPHCHDVFRLFKFPKSCECHRTWGYYKGTGSLIEISAGAIPIGISDIGLHKALEERPDDGLGAVFEAYVIPRDCKNIEER